VGVVVVAATAGAPLDVVRGVHPPRTSAGNTSSETKIAMERNRWSTGCVLSRKVFEDVRANGVREVAA